MELKSILHVDDEPDIREVVMIALEIIGGFEVRQADCGEQALEILQDYNPSLLLLDVMMPGLTGLQTLAQVHAMPGHADLPGVFMSAKGESLKVPDDLSDVLGIIPKPFNPTNLSQELTQMWELNN